MFYCAVGFRIAQAPVNIDMYRAWGLQFPVMPWPDVPQALQTGVITGLDHTPTVVSTGNFFNTAKHYTQIDYAQGLYILLINERWLQRLPADLRETLLRVIAEESARARLAGQEQDEREIAKAKAAGVTFYRLPAADLELMKEQAEPVIKQWEDRIGADLLKRVVVSSAVTSATLLIIVAGASVFGEYLTFEQIPNKIATAVVSSIDSPWVFLLAVNILLVLTFWPDLVLFLPRLVYS